MKKKINLLSIILLSTLCLWGCQNGEQQQPEENAAVKMEYEELTDIKEGRKNIYFIVKLYDSNYWKVMLEGAAAAGDDLDCNIYAAGSHAESEWKIQEELFEEAIERGADAIIFAADDSEKSVDIVNRAYEKGVKVILVDTTVNTDSYDVCYMTDNLMAGQNAAEEMIRLLREKGIADSEEAKVAIQVGSLNSQTINERLAGFAQYWTKYAPEKWSIIQDVKVNDGQIDVAIQCAKEFLSTYPDLNGVFGPNNGSSVGFATALMEDDRRDICMVGFDYSDEMAALVASDDFLASTMLQRQYDMGYRGVQSALEFIAGAASDVKFIDTGVAVVNKECLDEPDIQDIISHN